MSETFTLSKAIAKFIAWAEKKLAPGTVLDYSRHLKRSQVAVGDMPVEYLRAHHLVSWGKTWHNIVSVQRCFNWLFEVELITRSPFNRVKRPRPGRRKRIFTRHEFARLCRAASPAFRMFLIALRESMARPQEMRALQFAEIESADPSISIDAALAGGKAYFCVEEYKSRERRADPDQPRIIPISRRLGRMILRIRMQAAGQGGVVWRSDRGQAWTKEATRLRLARLRKHLGLGRDLRGEQLVCYSIRHTSATAATAKGLRDRILADIMGHTNTRTTARYQHPQTLHLVDAMRMLEGPGRTISAPASDDRIM